MNKVAKKGQVFVCGACGKRSKDMYGNKKIDSGWDASCMLNSALCDENSIKLKNGRVIKADLIK